MIGKYSIAALLLVITAPASAADTMIGPVDHLCKDVTASQNRAGLTLMWATGYISGVNNLSKVDFLRNKGIEQVLEEFEKVCLASPQKTVLEAARDVVAQFRISVSQPVKP